MDLLVDDKYTGKIAYRVAQAKAADIDRCATIRIVHALTALYMQQWKYTDMLSNACAQRGPLPARV